jgi:hypothetical protein
MPKTVTPTSNDCGSQLIPKIPLTSQFGTKELGLQKYSDLNAKLPAPQCVHVLHNWYLPRTCRRACVTIVNPADLLGDLERQAAEETALEALQHQDEEQAELEELEVQTMGAVEIMPIVRSKGLSADHVIIVGCDETNMGYVTCNALYVGLTRARKSLHLLTVLKAGGAKGMHPCLSDLRSAHTQFSKFKKSTHEKEPFGSRAECGRYMRQLNYRGNK